MSLRSPTMPSRSRSLTAVRAVLFAGWLAAPGLVLASAATRSTATASTDSASTDSASTGSASAAPESIAPESAASHSSAAPAPSAPAPPPEPATAPATAPAPAPAVATPARAAAVLFEVEINREPVGSTRLAKLPDGRLAARGADLLAWRLRIPEGVSPVLFAGEPHVPLEAFSGVKIVIDEALQRLSIDLPAAYFEPTQLVATPPRPPAPSRPPPGGFANYDLFFSRASGDPLGASTNSFTGQFEVGAFSRFGVVSSGLLVRGVGIDPSRVRLDTSWTLDLPDRTRTLTLGDAIGTSGLWGRPLRFGGLRYGTNFATNPTFVTFPLPGLRGEAVLPSVTDLYVDGVLRQSSPLPAGPFSISNVPVITGRGEVRLVTRDLLGREQVITLPYYASSQLLRAGLVDDAFEVGWIRNNFGLSSNDYGRFVSTYQQRRGISDRLTGEVRLEALADRQTGGGGVIVSLPELGVLTAAGAVSRGPAGTGQLAYAGFERQTRTGVSVGVRSQWATPEFTQLGLQPDQPAPKLQVSGNLGTSLGPAGSIGLGYVRQDNRDRPDARIGSLSYSLALGPRSALVLSAFKAFDATGSSAVSLTLISALDSATSASATLTTPTDPAAQVQLQRNLPEGRGMGYRLLAAGTGPQSRLEAGVALQNDLATVSLEAARGNGLEAYRANLSGSVALLDGQVFASRRLGDSFGLVHVPGFNDVEVLVNNQPAARTNSAGYAVLPRLLPFQSNPVRLEIGQLPMDTTIGASEIDAVPYSRSGVVLRFPIERSRGALIRLVLEDGSPMPVGAQVKVTGRDASFPVAARGEVFVDGLSARNGMSAEWRGQRCMFQVDLEDGGPVQPRVGPITCSGVDR